MPKTPSLAAMLQEAGRANLATVHVAIPARVVDVRSQSRVDIQPLIQNKRQQTSTSNPRRKEILNEDAPVITSCPVLWMGSGAGAAVEWALTGPIEVGTTGLAVFSHRDIDNWLTEGGVNAEATDTRRHAPDDAIFIPGLRSFKDALADAAFSPDGPVIYADNVKVGDNTAAKQVLHEDALQINDDLIAALNAAILASAGGSNMALFMTTLTNALALINTSQGKSNRLRVTD